MTAYLLCTLLVVTAGALPSRLHKLNSAKDSVSQVHIAQGATPSSMAVSWVTQYPSVSQVRFGTSKSHMTEVSSGYAFNYSFPVNNYNSPMLHHVTVMDLKPNTVYYYQCGDIYQGLLSPVYSFTTTLAVGDKRPMKFAIIGDLGQTDSSAKTVGDLNENDTIDMILHAGDLAYADCEPTRWDSYFAMVEPLASRMPWMVCPGNHEIEYINAETPVFLGYENRVKMPGALSPSWATHSPAADYCTPSEYTSTYDYGNSFFSFETGMTHVIVLNSYTQTHSDSPQYKWLENDFQTIQRDRTPWVIVILHGPWYNSNTAHQEESQTVAMRKNMEPLFFENGVNMVFCGHVHAYERSHPVYQGKVNKDGPTYVVIGDGGNREGLASKYISPTPAWSAHRDGSSFGYGELLVHSATSATWTFYHNTEGQVEDQVELENAATRVRSDLS